jgi:hypothetical protein
MPVKTQGFGVSRRAAVEKFAKTPLREQVRSLAAFHARISCAFRLSSLS